MLTPQYLLPISDELIIDLFAGGGGASTGIELIRPHPAARSGYEPMCGFYSCGNLVFERVAYCDRPPLACEESIEWARWRESVWRASVDELWGRP